MPLPEGSTIRHAGIIDVKGFGQTHSSCILSECGKYRYELTRHWDAFLPLLVFILLNPSTATHEVQDPTARRGMGFARVLGYGGICFVNLFAYRATDPNELKDAADPVGPANDQHILERVRAAHQLGVPVIAAWGAHGHLNNRDDHVIDLIGREKAKLHALHITKQGHPGHVLYLNGDSKPVLWQAIGASGRMQRC